MDKYKTEIFFLVVVPFIFLFSPMAHVRYYYESFTGDGFEFFSNFAICAENKNGDYEIFDTDYGNNVINISSRYRRGSFYFSGELINGIKDVEIIVNNKPVDDVDLSFPQGMRWFWEHFYLVKNFSCYINLKIGTNVVIMKSGKTIQKIRVNVGSD